MASALRLAFPTWAMRALPVRQRCVRRIGQPIGPGRARANPTSRLRTGDNAQTNFRRHVRTRASQASRWPARRPTHTRTRQAVVPARPYRVLVGSRSNKLHAAAAEYAATAIAVAERGTVHQLVAVTSASDGKRGWLRSPIASSSVIRMSRPTGPGRYGCMARSSSTGCRAIWSRAACSRVSARSGSARPPARVAGPTRPCGSPST